MINRNNLILSVLIPTCNYLIGLKRILNSIENIPTNSCEIIISDNSNNDEIKNYVNSWRSENSQVNIKYYLNRPITTAVENWNSLLDKATGEYCLLLHNGEVPSGGRFFDVLLSHLKNHSPDVAILNCVVVDKNRGTIKEHLPSFIRSLVVNYFPSYLFRRNVIGPTSSLVIKRSNYKKFDDNLKWLIDVDSYYQSIQGISKIMMLNDIYIYSIQENEQTLTASLSDQIQQIEKEERKYLSDNKYNNIWLNNGRFWNVMLHVENLIWKVFVKIHSYMPINKEHIDNVLKIWEIK